MFILCPCSGFCLVLHTVLYIRSVIDLPRLSSHCVCGVRNAQELAGVLKRPEFKVCWFFFLCISISLCECVCVCVCVCISAYVFACMYVPVGGSFFCNSFICAKLCFVMFCYFMLPYGFLFQFFSFSFRRHTFIFFSISFFLPFFYVGARWAFDPLTSHLYLLFPLPGSCLYRFYGWPKQLNISLKMLVYFSSIFYLLSSSLSDLIWFDLIWFDLIWFDLIWFDTL